MDNEINYTNEKEIIKVNVIYGNENLKSILDKLIIQHFSNMINSSL